MSLRLQHSEEMQNANSTGWNVIDVAQPPSCINRQRDLTRLSLICFASIDHNANFEYKALLRSRLQMVVAYKRRMEVLEGVGS
jgi:hypothetical protein